MKHLLLADGWQWKQRNRAISVAADFASLDGWTSASVPGTIHQELLATGQIPDPFLALNEQETQWIGTCDWLYRCSFVVPSGFAGTPEELTLVCEGLDTFATAWLNGTQILQSENMFLPSRVSVNALLQPGKNELHLLFQSALLRGKEREDQYGQRMAWNGDPSRVYVRKAQYHYGWDWGPTLLTAGPWQPVRLEAWSARIADLNCSPEVSSDLASASLPVHIALETSAANTASGLELYLVLSSPIGETLAEARLPAARTELYHTFLLPDPQLWWPSGYGEQPLYQLAATLVQETETLDQQTQRLGLRRLRLRQEPLAGEPGSSFFFEINNTPIFCNGANWIPADSFLPRVTPEQYRSWLQLAADAHMVMLRVWGGGIYEQDAFYQTCDELGLLVWQDCMFACGIYPTCDWFLENVRAEVEAQVCRLRNHACIVLWCGNNEDQMVAEATEGFDPGTRERAVAETLPAYRIYEQVLPEIFARLDPSRPYWPGSPYGGARCNASEIGDQHVWAVWHQGVAYQDYGKLAGRFVSEFGMQAYPELPTIAAFAPAAELYPQSRTLDHHNKAVGGPGRLASYLAENVRIPENLENYIYATQLIQAEALASAVRSWRRCWQGPGREYVAGALVWQLNDCWPVTSWAVVDYWQRPKPAYYVLKREMAPLALGLASHSAGGVEIWGVNGLTRSLEGTLHAQCWTLDGTLLREELRPVVLEANRSTELGNIEFSGAGQCIFSVQLSQGEQILARATLWPVPLKYLTFPEPAITIEKLGQDLLRIQSRRPAKGVWLSATHSVKWSDNMLDLLPEQPQIIAAEGLGEADVEIRWLKY